VVLDQPLVPRVLYGNYEAHRFVFAARFWPFLPLLFAANPDLLPRDSDKVTAPRSFVKINIARQNPTLYANFLEQTVAVSRLAVSSDITGAMGAMQEAESVVTA
jgi:hypothetical protein